MKPALLLFSISLIIAGCGSQGEPVVDGKDEFSFAFLTDIHLKPESGAEEGFAMAIEKVNELAPDFVITGGDLIDDALYSSYERADSLYRLYESYQERLNMPVHNAMGNHDIYGYNARPPADPSHPEYGEKIFEKRIGKRYYSFDHGGWHFMVLDGVEEGEGEWGNYVGLVDRQQMEWIREDLSALEPGTPVVAAIHIPLVSVSPQIKNGPQAPAANSEVVVNARQVLDLFREANLKLVLQGHLHTLEEITVLDRVTFVTGGAVCGLWWRTPDDSPFQEGFVLVKVSGDEFSWDYVDYGWETGITSERKSE